MKKIEIKNSYKLTFKLHESHKLLRGACRV